MSLLISTLLYMFIATILLFTTDIVFSKTNFRNYNVLLDGRDKFFFYMTVITLLYFIYVIAFMELILPLYISGIMLAMVWFYFFVFDIELRVMPKKDKFLLLIITVTMIILTYLSFVYILSLGLIKFVRIDLNDHSKIFDTTPTTHTLELMSQLDESEIDKYTNMLVGLYRSKHIESLESLKSSIFQVLSEHENVETITREYKI